MFDYNSRRTLGVKERPLLLMDGSLTHRQYLGLDPASDEAINRIRALKDVCRQFQGEFVVLWHNDVLAGDYPWDLFREATNAAAEAT
jgi:hypothetical protein